MQVALIGCDPELSAPYERMTEAEWTAFDHKMHQCGTKAAPSVWNGVQIHADSIFVEVAPRPQPSVGRFLNAFFGAKEIAENIVEMPLSGRDYVDLQTLPAFSQHTAPFLWERANEAGCAPDILDGVYRYEPPPWVPTKPVKEAAGHLHIDLPEHMLLNEDSIRDVARDFYAETRTFHGWDHASNPWYRIPLLYRITPYGFEYRSIGAGAFNDSATLEMLLTTAFNFQRSLFKGGK